jgi:hypothetical protein
MNNTCEWGTCDATADTTLTVNHDNGKGYVTESYCPECADMRQAELEDREYGFREGLGFFAPSMVLCESGEIDGGTRCDEEHLYVVWHVPACHRSTATTAGTARGVATKLPICSCCYEHVLDAWTWDVDAGDEAPALCEDDEDDEDDDDN